MKFGGLSLTLGASGALALLIVGASLSTTAGSNPDADGDTIIDLVDNCLGKQNKPNAQGYQDDCDFDGFGDACDGDLDNSGAVTVADFILFGASFLKLPGAPLFNECADMNQSGTVNVPDFLLFGAQQIAGVPGPSGLKCAKLDASSPNMTGRARCWFLNNQRIRCPVGSQLADASGILTNPTSTRDLRFINKRHYAHIPGGLGGHCVP
jgi:hypothetical protein